MDKLIEMASKRSLSTTGKPAKKIKTKGQVVKKDKCEEEGESIIGQLQIDLQEEKDNLIEDVSSTSNLEKEKAAALVQKGELNR